jgi:hypothetical protein
MPTRSRKIEIVSYLMPSSNPRVPKEVEALTGAGFDVTVVSSALPGTSRMPTCGSGAFALRRLNNRAAWWGLWRHRLMKKCALLWPHDMRVQVSAYGSLFVDLVRFLRKSPRDVLRIIHLEPSLLAAPQAGGFGSMFCDFEDWYSRDLLPGSRSAELTSALQAAERAALHQSLACWCTSQAMASALGEAYGANEPLVVRNVFPRRLREAIDGQWKDRPKMTKLAATNNPSLPRPVDAPVSFYWFSQTIGPGRGLEELLLALEGVQGAWELHLRGGLTTHARWLEQTCPGRIRSRVFTHDLVALDEVTSRVAEHDVGYCGEPWSPENKNVTISNKFFHYLQGGLAVVASSTSGQREASQVAQEAVELYTPGNIRELTGVLQKFVSDRQALRAARSYAFKAGADLCWENESPKLVEAVEKALDRRSANR